MYLTGGNEERPRVSAHRSGQHWRENVYIAPSIFKEPMRQLVAPKEWGDHHRNGCGGHLNLLNDVHYMLRLLQPGKE